MVNLIADQFRALFFLVRGSDAWRPLLRTDASAAVPAVILLLLSTWLTGVVIEASDAATAQPFGKDFAYVALGCALSGVLAIAWRRQEMARASVFASAWYSAAATLLSLPILAIAGIFAPGPTEDISSRALAAWTAFILALVVAFAWPAYRIVRTMLRLRRWQAISFVVLEAFLSLFIVVAVDLVLGTHFLLSEEMRAIFGNQ